MAKRTQHVPSSAAASAAGVARVQPAQLAIELPAGKLDAADMFLLNGFFEILEKAIDRCREAGVVAYQIVLKNS